MSHYFYMLDETGEQPILCSDYVLWESWFENVDNRQVASKQIGEKMVSTVFLGIDHGYGGPPILWETMVFGSNNEELEKDRCTGDRNQALAMHELMVERMEALQALEYSKSEG